MALSPTSSRSTSGGGSGGGATPVTTVAASGAAQTVNASVNTSGLACYDVTLTANCTLTVTGGVAAEECVIDLVLRQDATGSRTVTWPANVNAPGGGTFTPTLTTTPLNYDTIQLVSVDGGTNWTGYVVGSNMAPQAVPAAPSLSAVGTAALVSLSWSAPLSYPPITGYKLYRGTSAGTETLYQTLGNVTTYADTGVVNGTTYYYKVSAVNSVGEGALSSEQSATPTAFGAGTHYLNGTGAGSSDASTPSTAALNITGAIDIRARVQFANWVPAANQALVSKWSAAFQQYYFYLDTAGKLNLAWNTGSFKNVTCSVATGFGAATTNWVRAALTPDDGTGHYQVIFYTSSDGVTWSQIGATATGVGTSIQVPGTPQALLVGATDAGASNNATAKFFAAEVMSGIAGTPVAQPDFSVQAGGTTSFAGVTGETWTVNAPASII